MSSAAQRCPLCGLPNSCTQTVPQAAHLPCWCFAVRIEPRVLAALPEALRGAACLCPNCAQGPAAADQGQA